MSSVFVVWLTVTLVATLAIAAVLIGLIRHVLGLGRTLRRFRDEVTPIADEISAEADRAAVRAAGMSAPRGRDRS